MSEASLNESLSRKQKYRELLEEGDRIRASSESDLTKLENISRIVKQSDVLLSEGNPNDRAEHSTEVVLDASVMKMSHELFGDVMRKIISSEFLDEEFQNALTRIVFKYDDENWKALASIAADIAHTTKFSSCLLGTVSDEVSVVEKEAKVRQRRTKAELAKELQPDIIKKLDKQDEGAQKVNTVLKQIRKLYSENNSESIPFYKLVIDPENFMNTIDNVFQVAFLVRDDRIAVEIGNDGYPTVRPISNTELNQSQHSTNAIQEICSFNPNFIKKMIKRYEIYEPVLMLNREQNINSSQMRTQHSRRPEPSTSQRR